MKKALLFLALVLAVSFSSCTDLNEDYEDTFETSAIEKDDSTTQGSDGEEDPDDTED